MPDERMTFGAMAVLWVRASLASMGGAAARRSSANTASKTVRLSRPRSWMTRSSKWAQACPSKNAARMVIWAQ